MMKAISLWQPWPWLIFRPDLFENPYYEDKTREQLLTTRKDVENRPVHYKYKGELVICATQKLDPNLELLRADLRDRWQITLPARFDTGGIVGVITVSQMVDRYESPWFTGPWAWPILKRRIIPFQAMSGKQGLFNLSPHYEKYVKTELAKL